MEKKITVITGGNGGIGKSVVKKFLKKDIVIVLDINSVDDEEILKNTNYNFMNIDVTKPEEIEKAANEIKRKYGHVDNLISMAGINMKSEIGGLAEITISDIDKSIKLNLNSHIYVIKIFLELLKTSDEVKNFIMISSINSISDYGLPAYSAAKSGLYGFMKAITNELGKSRIRTNIISLGTVPHEHDEIEGNDYFESKLKSLPIKEFINPSDVADALYGLIYHMKGIMGHNLILDKGQSV